MHYQVFNADNGEPLDTVRDVKGLVWQPGDKVTLRVDGKEAMFMVTVIGPFQYEGKDLVAVARVKMLTERGDPVLLGKPESGGI